MKIFYIILILAVSLLYSCGHIAKESTSDINITNTNSTDTSTIVTNKETSQKQEPKQGPTKEVDKNQIDIPVSYTHLTLPTKA